MIKSAVKKKKDDGENEDENVSSKHASQSEESAPEQSASTTGPAEHALNRSHGDQLPNVLGLL